MLQGTMWFGMPGDADGSATSVPIYQSTTPHGITFRKTISE